MNEVYIRRVRRAGREENGGTIWRPVRPREELDKLRGELPLCPSDRIKDVQLAVVIEFAYERD